MRKVILMLIVVFSCSSGTAFSQGTAFPPGFPEDPETHWFYGTPKWAWWDLIVRWADEISSKDPNSQSWPSPRNLSNPGVLPPEEGLGGGHNPGTRLLRMSHRFLCAGDGWAWPPLDGYPPGPIPLPTVLPSDVGIAIQVLIEELGHGCDVPISGWVIANPDPGFATLFNVLLRATTRKEEAVEEVERQNFARDTGIDALEGLGVIGPKTAKRLQRGNANYRMTNVLAAEEACADAEAALIDLNNSDLTSGQQGFVNTIVKVVNKTATKLTRIK